MSANVNTTTNGTLPLNCFSNSTAEKIGETFAYCLIFVVSLVGNSLVGIIVHKTRTMKKPINLLMVNMAMSDLLFTSFIIPRIIIKLYVDSWLVSGFLGEALCKLVPFTYNVSYDVSVQSLVLITVDRFGAVVFPLRSPLIRSKLCPLFILVTWIAAMAAESPYLISNNLVEYPEGLKCVGVFTGDFLQMSPSYKNYILVEFIVFIATPSVLVAILYTIIYFKVKTLTIPDEQSASERQPLVRRERTVLKLAIAIVLCFAACWLPWCIVWILFNFVSDKWSCGVQYFAAVALFMSKTYSAINPCILFLFSKNYRQSLRNLVKRF